jgi:thiol-disulfide isomerase/thioredoxin
MSRSLVIVIGLAAVAFIGVTVTMVMKVTAPERPPMHGAMAEFKLETPPKPVLPGAFVDGDGKPHDLSVFKGKVTLINFWATWCAPCVKELPSLDRLKRAHDSDKFQVVTISEDHGGEVALIDFFNRTGIRALPHYLDTDAAYSRLLKFDSLPTTIVLDAEGREVARYDTSAPEWDSPDAWSFLDFYVSKLTPAAG